MKKIFLKTFGGLSLHYLIRHFIFGVILGGVVLYMEYSRFKSGTDPLNLGLIIFVVISLLLYPYSRYVYESIIGFIIGNIEMRVNAVLFLATKLFTMNLCFVFSIFIAPIGLAYLYYRNSKEQDNTLDYNDHS